MPDRSLIRPMTEDDVDAAADVLVGGGWGDRRAFFRFAIDHPTLTPYVAEVDERVVGTGVATVNGRVGWIGTIFVDEGLRGRGIGTALTAAVCDRLDEAGCVSQVLLASPFGRPIYRRLGFASGQDYVGLQASGGGADGDLGPWRLHPDQATAGSARGEPSGRLRPYRPADLEALLALDRAASGEDRGHVLRLVVDPASTVVTVDPDDRVVGYDARPSWGTHPTIAPAYADGIRLLEDRRARHAAGSEVATAIPDVNRRGITTLENLGWREVRRVTRMTRGEPVPWQPTAIWGQFSFAIG